MFIKNKNYLIKKKIEFIIIVILFFSINNCQALDSNCYNYSFYLKNLNPDSTQINLKFPLTYSRQYLGLVPGIISFDNTLLSVPTQLSYRGLGRANFNTFNLTINDNVIITQPIGNPQLYYTPPPEAINTVVQEKYAQSLIEIPQLGGSLRFLIDEENVNPKPRWFITNSIGSNNYISNFFNIKQRLKKMEYNVFFNRQSGDGWRQNNQFNTHTFYSSANLYINPNNSLTVGYIFNTFLQQLPGSLTDLSFYNNAQKSNRARNWQNLNWQNGFIKYYSQISSAINFQIRLATIYGLDTKIGFFENATIQDSINTAINNYNFRQLNKIGFNSWDLDFRFNFNYYLLNLKQELTIGLKYYQGETQQQFFGLADQGINFNTNLISSFFPQDLVFNNKNYALFVQNIFKISEKLIIVPGLRLEHLTTDFSGRYFTDTVYIYTLNSTSHKRYIGLANLKLQYKNKNNNYYLNIGKTYRPILNSEFIPVSPIDEVDPKLKDPWALNLDLGVNGHIKNGFIYTINLFWISLNKHIATILNNQQSSSLFTTNVGNSWHRGIESNFLLNFNKLTHKSNLESETLLQLTFNYLLTNYKNYKTLSNYKNSTVPYYYLANNLEIQSNNINGNIVEYAPKYIINMGLNYRYKSFSFIFNARNVGNYFTDNLNSQYSSPSGNIGKINSYLLYDFIGKFNFNNKYFIQAAFNNLTNVSYATYRDNFGIVPATGRTIYISLILKL